MATLCWLACSVLNYISRSSCKHTTSTSIWSCISFTGRSIAMSPSKPTALRCNRLERLQSKAPNVPGVCFLLLSSLQLNVKWVNVCEHAWTHVNTFSTVRISHFIVLQQNSLFWCLRSLISFDSQIIVGPIKSTVSLFTVYLDNT